MKRSLPDLPITVTIRRQSWTALFPRRVVIPKVVKGWTPTDEAVRTLAVIQAACGETPWEFVSTFGIRYKYTVSAITPNGSILGPIRVWRGHWSTVKSPRLVIERDGRLVGGVLWMRKKVETALGPGMAVNDGLELTAEERAFFRGPGDEAQNGGGGGNGTHVE